MKLMSFFNRLLILLEHPDKRTKLLRPLLHIVKYPLRNTKLKFFFLLGSVMILLTIFFISMNLTLYLTDTLWIFYNNALREEVLQDLITIGRWSHYNLFGGNYFSNYYGVEGAVFGIVQSSSGLIPEIILFWVSHGNKEWLFSPAWYSLVALSGPILFFIIFYFFDAFFLQPFLYEKPAYVMFVEEENLPYVPEEYDEETEEFSIELWWQYFHYPMTFAMVASCAAFVHIDGYYWLLEFRYDYSNTLISSAWDVHLDTKEVSRLRLDRYREAYDTYSKLLLTQAQNHVFLQTFLDVLQIRYGPTTGQYFYLTPHTSFSAEPFYLSQRTPANLSDLRLDFSSIKEVFSNFKENLKPNDRNTFSALNQFGATFEEDYVDSHWIWNDFLFLVEPLSEIPHAKPVWSAVDREILKYPRSFSVARSRWQEFLGDMIPHYQLPVTSHNPYNYFFYAYKPHYSATLDFLEKLLFRGVSLDYFSILQNYMRPRIDKVNEYSVDFLRVLTGIHAKAAHPGHQRRNFHHYANGDIENVVKAHGAKPAFPTSYVSMDTEMDRWSKLLRIWEHRVRKRVPMQHGDYLSEAYNWKFRPRYFKLMSIHDLSKVSTFNFYTKSHYKPSYHSDYAYFMSRVKHLSSVSDEMLSQSKDASRAIAADSLKAKKLPHITGKLKRALVPNILKTSHFSKIYYFLDLFNYNKKVFTKLVPTEFAIKHPRIMSLWSIRSVSPNHLNIVKALSRYNLQLYPIFLQRNSGVNDVFLACALRNLKGQGFTYSTFYPKASIFLHEELLKSAFRMKAIFFKPLKFINSYHKLNKLDLPYWSSSYKNPVAVRLKYLSKFFVRNSMFSDEALRSGRVLAEANVLATENFISGSDGGVGAWEPMWILGSKIRTPLGYAKPRLLGTHVQVLYNRDSTTATHSAYSHDLRNYFSRWLTWLGHRSYTALGDQGYIHYPARKTKVSAQMPIYKRFRWFAPNLDSVLSRYLNANNGRLMRPYAVTWTDTWRRGVVWDVPNHIQVGALHFAWPFAFDRTGLVPVEWFYSRFTRNDFALNYSLIEWWSPDLRLTRTPAFASVLYKVLPDYVRKAESPFQQFTRFYWFYKKVKLKGYAYVIRNKILQRQALIQQLAAWRLGTSYHFYGVKANFSFTSTTPYSELLNVFSKSSNLKSNPIGLLERFNPFYAIPRLAYPVKFFDWLLGTHDTSVKDELSKLEDILANDAKIDMPKWNKIVRGKKLFKPKLVFKEENAPWKLEIECFPSISKKTIKILKTGTFDDLDGKLKKEVLNQLLEKKNLKVWYSDFSRKSHPRFLKALPKDNPEWTDLQLIWKRYTSFLKLKWRESPLSPHADETMKKEYARKHYRVLRATSRVFMSSSDLTLDLSPAKTVHALLGLLVKNSKFTSEMILHSSKKLSLVLSDALGTQWPQTRSFTTSSVSTHVLPGSLSKLVDTHFFGYSASARTFSLLKSSQPDRLGYFSCYENALFSSISVRAYRATPTYLEYMFALFDPKYKPASAGTFIAYHQVPTKYGLMNAILRQFHNAQARPVYFYSFKVMGAINSSPYRVVSVSSTPLHLISDSFSMVYDRYLDALRSIYIDHKKSTWFNKVVFSTLSFIGFAIDEDASNFNFEVIDYETLRVWCVAEFWYADFPIGWIFPLFSKVVCAFIAVFIACFIAWVLVPFFWVASVFGSANALTFTNFKSVFVGRARFTVRKYVVLLGCFVQFPRFMQYIRLLVKAIELEIADIFFAILIAWITHKIAEVNHMHAEYAKEVAKSHFKRRPENVGKPLGFGSGD